jgi:hypothetical protein
MSRRFINSQFTTQVQDVTPDVKELSVPEEGALIMCEGVLYVGVDNEWQRLYSSLPSGTNIGLFAQTGDSVAVTATTTETTIINGGVGTLSVPANGFNVGDTFRADFAGQMSAKNNDSIRIRVKAGSVVLADSGLQTMPTTTNAVWSLSLDFTIRQLGGAGTASVVTIGNFLHVKQSNNTSQGFGFNTVNNTTFNTTIPNTLDVTVQWSSNSADNSIYSDVFVLNKVY